MRHRKEGWLLRVYAKKAEDVPGRAYRVMGMITAIRLVSDGPIMVLIPKDKDCGRTATAIREMYLNARVEEVNGSPNIEVLNYGLESLYRQYECTHAVVVSNKAVEAVTEATMQGIWTAFGKGAKAVGVGFGEFTPFVKKGIILNTFAAYELQSAYKAGWFGYEHPDGGVEEVSLLLELTVHGRCLAFVESDGGEKIFNNPAAYGRAKKIRETKVPRVNEVLANARFPEDHLQQFLMR